jgi:DNA-binding transcriptional regulator PaaX
MRRALAILIASLGSTHPNSQIVSSNFVELLEQLGRSETEITAAVRACKP